MELALNNLRNSGVFVVVSAGNDGIKNCGSIRKPSAMFENAFTIGSTRLIYDSTGVKFQDTISGFSSRGPVMIDGSNRLKPDVTAPGSWVLSCVPNNGYRYFSGTSMAGPHVAGVVALMVSANPELKGQVNEIEEILLSTADPKFDIDSCRGIYESVLPNSTYGYGRINAFKAVESAIDFSVSTDEIDFMNSELVVFPNPFIDEINISVKDINKPFVIEIYNLLGELVFNNKIENKSILNLDYLNSGLYIFKTEFNGLITTKKGFEVLSNRIKYVLIR